MIARNGSGPDDPAAVSADVTRAGLFALMEQLRRSGVLPRSDAAAVLDTMIDVVLKAQLAPEHQFALVTALRAGAIEADRST